MATTINGEGIVTEECRNDKDWLIEERTYLRRYFDYNQCPTREMLADPDDRVTYHVHDDFGREIFVISGEGYVTEYGYEQSDKPTTTWCYPKKIQQPETLTISAIRTLLPSKENIPCTKIEYDPAGRKIAAR